MKHLFLYRIYKHSPLAFVCCVAFMICYAITFYKKMDMTFFPYNSMFTVDFYQTNTATTYGMKLNAQLITITKHPYWKKDFLETSLANYGKYVSQGQTLFIENYLDQRFKRQGIHDFLSGRLVPGKADMQTWPVWYCRFAGYEVPQQSTIELMQYHLSYENGKAVATDSVSILKNIYP